jgi:hypothetical protein
MILYDEKQASESDWAAMRASLKRAIELAPRFVEAAEMLASANLARNTDIPETVEILTRAAESVPGRDSLLLQLAYALSRTPEREAARPLTRNLLLKPGLDASIRKSAQSLMDFLDRAASFDATNRANAEQKARQEALGAVVAGDAPPPELRRATRRAADPSPAAPGNAAGTERLRGTLTELDCTAGVALLLTIDDKAIRLHTNSPNSLRFTSLNPAVKGGVRCGPIPGGGLLALVTYRPSDSADSLGEPLAVEFRIPGTTVMRGLVTAVECGNGVVVSLAVEGKTVRFRAATPESVAFLNGPNPDGTTTCGPVEGSGIPAAVVYRPLPTAEFLGEPLVVQFGLGN